MTKAQEERLFLLIEECSEVIQAATKVLRFGIDGCYDNGEKNIIALMREMGDVRGAMIIMCRAGDVSKEFIHKQADSKLEKFKEFSKHN